jgi:hypothetical protein
VDDALVKGRCGLAHDLLTPTWRFWALWAVAFLGFPLGGSLAALLIGSITTTVQAGLAGAITGAILGGVQWLVLRTAMPLPLWWVVATSAGMSLGLALSTAFFGSETSGNDLLWRAGITGLSIGIAQWLVLHTQRRRRPRPEMVGVWLDRRLGLPVTHGVGSLFLLPSNARNEVICNSQP